MIYHIFETNSATMQKLKKAEVSSLEEGLLWIEDFAKQNGMIVIASEKDAANNALDAFIGSTSSDKGIIFAVEPSDS